MPPKAARRAEGETRSAIETMYERQAGEPITKAIQEAKPDIRNVGRVMPTSQHKDDPTYSIRLVPGVVNTVEVTAVTQAQKNGINGFAAGVERWEMERFRVYLTPLQQ